MANTFKRVTVGDVGTTLQTVYTVPVNTTTVVIGFILANTSSSLLYVDIEAAGAIMGNQLPLPVGSSMSVLDGKLVLEAADTVTVTSSEATSLDVILSIMEIS